MKDRDQHEESNGRREFLKQMALGGGAMAVAAVSGGALAAEETDVPTPAKPAARKGYHETDHIREYYRTAAL
jgi:nitrous oxide reductase